MRIAVEFDSLEEFQSFFSAPAMSAPAAIRVAPPSGVTPVAASQEASVEVEKPKRTRRTKAELAADAAAQAAPPVAQPAADVDPEEAPTAQSSEFDPPAEVESDFLDDDVAPAPALTKDDVRAALVSYQERLTASGKDLETARATVLALLKKVSGADKLGGCPDNKFAEVIKAAHNAK